MTMFGKGHAYVLELKLHYDPERVEHEECKARVVAEFFKLFKLITYDLNILL
jgi:hypothetical protein